LKIYWARFFLFGGSTTSFDLTFHRLIQQSSGLGRFVFFQFCQRFEWREKFSFTVRQFKKRTLKEKLDKPFLQVINYYLSSCLSINDTLRNMTNLGLLRLYLIRSYRGRAYLLRKPSHGQRTRSNARSAKIHNITLIPHIKAYRQHRILQLKSVKKEDFYRKKPSSKPSKPVKVLKKKRFHVPVTAVKIQHWF